MLFVSKEVTTFGKQVGTHLFTNNSLGKTYFPTYPQKQNNEHTFTNTDKKYVERTFVNLVDPNSEIFSIHTHGLFFFFFYS